MLDYGCDKCEERKDFDNGIIWITSSYGVCYECYDKLSEEEYKQIELEYE